MTITDEPATHTTRLSEYVAGGQTITTDAPTSGYQDAASRLGHVAEAFRTEFLAAAAAAPEAPELDTPGELIVPAAWVDPTATQDWRSHHDPRSREYAVRAMLRHPVPVQDHMYALGPILDQDAGVTGNDAAACTGMMAAALSNVLEAGHGGDEWMTANDARSLYHRAQVLDDYPGTDYAGSSVLAAMKAGVERSLWEAYVWCFGTRDVAQAILQVGPVGIGVPWLSGMEDVGADGIITVTGSAGLGHAMALVGLRMEVAGRPGPWFVGQQSRGPEYGDHGLVYLHHKDLARLLAGVGEAAVPLAGPPPTPA